jgi:hypothetical protein
MNMIWLNQPSRLRGSHESIGLDYLDSPLAKLLLNAVDVRLARGRVDISPKIVASKLHDNDFSALRNVARESSQHAARCISGYACIRDP